MTTTTMRTRTTIRYGNSKLVLACASFLAFAGLAAALAERQPTNDDGAAAATGTVHEIAIEDEKVLVPESGPVTRSRGS